MKRNITLFSILFLLLFLLQYTIVPLRYKNCSPDYLFILVIVAAMFGKEKFGAVFGLIVGIFCDFADGMLFGVKSILFMVFGYLIGMFLAKILSCNVFTAYVLFFIAFLVSELVYLGVYSTFTSQSGLQNILLNYLFPQFIMTIPFVSVIYAISRLFINLGERKRNSW